MGSSRLVQTNCCSWQLFLVWKGRSGGRCGTNWVCKLVSNDGAALEQLMLPQIAPPHVRRRSRKEVPWTGTWWTKRGKRSTAIWLAWLGFSSTLCFLALAIFRLTELCVCVCWLAAESTYWKEDQRHWAWLGHDTEWDMWRTRSACTVSPL